MSTIKVLKYQGWYKDYIIITSFYFHPIYCYYLLLMEVWRRHSLLHLSHFHFYDSSFETRDICKEFLMFPNFRKIYTQFRTEEEEKHLANAAVYKFCGFVVISAIFIVGRHIALQKE